MTNYFEPENENVNLEKIETLKEKDISSKEESASQEIVQDEDTIYEKKKTKYTVYYKITLTPSNLANRGRINKLVPILSLFNKLRDWFDGEINY